MPGDIVQARPSKAVRVRQEKCEINVTPTCTKVRCGAKEDESTLRTLLCHDFVNIPSPAVPPVIFSTSLLFTLIHRLYLSTESRVAAPPCHLVDRFCFPGKTLGTSDRTRMCLGQDARVWADHRLRALRVLGAILWDCCQNRCR